MDLRHTDDTSLQAWGRSLRQVAPALQEIEKQHKPGEEAIRETARVIRAMAQQAENDLPASDQLTAEFQAIAKELDTLVAESEALAARRRALVAQAEGLPALYRQEHETDEDRLNAPRKSRAVERRADVSVAEQDT